MPAKTPPDVNSSVAERIEQSDLSYESLRELAESDLPIDSVARDLLTIMRENE